MLSMAPSNRVSSVQVFYLEDENINHDIKYLHWNRTGNSEKNYDGCLPFLKLNLLQTLATFTIRDAFSVIHNRNEAIATTSARA
jgi:DNA-directed RNA polymerase